MSSSSPTQGNAITAQEQALLQRANRQLWDGDWRGAARLLMNAAELAQARGHMTDAARGRQMAASLFRFSGDTQSALSTAQALAATPGDPQRVAFGAAAERAESLAAAGDPGGAVLAYREALQHADALALPRAWRAVVLRRLGEALARAGQSDAAVAVYSQARALHVADNDALGIALIDIECAEALVGTGAWQFAAAAVDTACRNPTCMGEAGLSARVSLLRARLAQHAGDTGAAVAVADEARQLSLRAVEPVSFFAASALLAQLYDGIGDRVAAYRVLASAWATLSDMLGREIGASWVRPLLLAFSAAWGEAAFAEIKAIHDAQRRAERDGGTPTPKADP